MVKQSLKYSALILGGIAAALVISASGLTPVGGLSAQAETETRVARHQCVDIANIDTRRVIDSKTLYIKDNFGRAALLHMAPPCQNMEDMDRFGFELSGSSQMCGPHDIHISYAHSYDTIGLSCVVEDFTPLTKEEAKAIEKGDMPSHLSSGQKPDHH